MANLVTVTKELRLVIKYGGITLGVILFIFFGVKAFVLMQNLLFPKPAAPPVQAFGKLPRIVFPSSGTSGIEFRINTIEGVLPKLKDRVNVYKFVQSEADLLALKNTSATLARAGFTGSQTKVNDTVYRFTNADTGAVIQYDIVSKNFTVSSNYLSNPNLTATSFLPAEADIKSRLAEFLTSVSADTRDIDFDNSKVTFLKVVNGALINAENLGEAKVARVTLIQKPVDEIPIIYNTPESSIIHFLVSFPNRQIQVIDGEFSHHQPSLEEKSDYPIKTAEQAFEELKAGNAFMINPLNLKSVDITSVEVKYYLDINSKDYLLPVIVFTGINFTGYVEAIASDSLN